MRNPKLVTKKKENSKNISDPEIERKSKEQKDLRLYIEKCQNHEQMWAHRWIIAKTQIQDITVHITGQMHSTQFKEID